jgi:arylformamidase
MDMRIYDLSPRLHSGLAVWPGDTLFSVKRSLNRRRGDPVDLAAITLTLHAGAHLDAPSHVLPEGPTIDQVELWKCLGPARVIHLDAKDAIGAELLAPKLASRPPRVLVRANPGRDRSRFVPEFTFFSTGAARLLVERGVHLVGTDAPSVDAFVSGDLPAHRILAEAGVVILENLVLDEVPEGEYDLVALPLRIVGGEASPVRAVLIGDGGSTWG